MGIPPSLIAGLGTLIGTMGQKKAAAAAVPTDALDTVSNKTGTESTKGNETLFTSGSSLTTGVTGNTSSSTSQNRTVDNTNTMSTGATTDNTKSSQQSSGATTNLSTGEVVDSSLTTGKQTTLGFEEGIMDQLNALLGSAIGNSGIADGQQSINTRLTQLSGGGADFDVTSFVDGITAQAESRMAGDTEGKINALSSATGGTESGNTMAALLAQRMRTDAASELAGVRAQATATGTQIANQGRESLTDQMIGLQGSGSNTLQGLIQSLSGAQQTGVNEQSSAGKQSSTQADRGTQVESVLSDQSSVGTSRDSTNTNSESLSRDSSGTQSTTKSAQTQKSQQTQKSASDTTTTSKEQGVESGSNSSTQAIFDQLPALFGVKAGTGSTGGSGNLMTRLASNGILGQLGSMLSK